jgi:hypothetical protein
MKIYKETIYNEWRKWFAWYPVSESEEYGLNFYFLETIQRKWIPSQCYGHFGNYIYKDLTNSN